MEDKRWTFTRDQIKNTAAQKSGYDQNKETFIRQKAASVIYEMGTNLRLSSITINTAIVYMHRFYMFHPMNLFRWHEVAPAAVYLAAKTEENHRRMKCVIKALNHVRHVIIPPDSTHFANQCKDLLLTETVLLQTLGFDLMVEHPHMHVVTACYAMKVPKHVAHAAFILATKSLQLTTFCLEYQPKFVACVCINVACYWLNYQLPTPSNGLPWYSLLDDTIQAEELVARTKDFRLLAENHKDCTKPRGYIKKQVNLSWIAKRYLPKT
ncbi:cyclin-T1-like [Aethina tumida]|uniref:cyclin-T1-like n=1 Tax=Aethina tumida TaxID=116153 RepID=UPI00214871BF|nr:cyclin-T1-like [Aethina tumida]